MKKTIIISGGEKGGMDFALDYARDLCTSTYIIACDKGYAYAAEEGIRPDLIIGDFDSYEGQLPEDVPVERLPVEKDDTDTVHAMREAVSNGSDIVVICCALGGRLDHLLSNIQTARYAAERGLTAIVVGKDTIFTILKDKTLKLKKDTRYSLSVLSLSDESVVSVTGTKYRAENVRMTADFPLGQSNEWQENEAVITVSSGTVAVIQSLLQNKN